MKRILIIEVNWLGDILFTTPAIRAVRENNPDAFISCVAVPRCVDMLKGNPHIDDIIVFDEKGRDRGIIKKLQFISILRKKRFDTVISFHRSMSRMLMAAIAGIPRRVGYYTRKRSWLLTDSVEQPIQEPHRVEYFLNITRAIGADTENKDYEFNISHGAFENAEKILTQAGVDINEKFFIVNPGANWLPKRWPAARYGELCKRLKDVYNVKIIITGSEKDIRLADEIIASSENAAVSICAKTGLKELGAVMKKASLVVANDSGPMHIAVSQKTPTVALFGPTSPDITGPYGRARYIVLNKYSECEIPCYQLCDDYRCMEAISVDDVMEAADKMIER